MEKATALLVLNYNCRPFLQECLDSLLSQNYGNFEIFFIDNSSTDDSVVFVKKNYPQIKIMENKENVGVGRGFNEVIRKIRNDFSYIGLFNSDIKVDKDWLGESVGTLERNPEPEICAGLNFDWGGNVVDSAGGVIVNLLAGVFGGFLGDLPVDQIPSRYRKTEFPVFFAVVTAMLVRADVFTTTGLFDEDYFMYFEDIDFSWRVLLGGGKIFCNPRARAYHYGHGSKPGKDISVKVHGSTETNLLATYFKNLSLLSLILVLPPLVLIRTIASFFYLFVSPRLTWGKLSGIFLFVSRLFSPRLWRKRQRAQKRRKLNDRQVFKNNPQLLFSVRPLLKFILPWFKAIRKIYHG